VAVSSDENNPVRQFVAAGRAAAAWQKCWSDAQPRFGRATEDIGERFKSPLGHHPAAYIATRGPSRQSAAELRGIG